MSDAAVEQMLRGLCTFSVGVEAERGAAGRWGLAAFGQIEREHRRRQRVLREHGGDCIAA